MDIESLKGLAAIEDFAVPRPSDNDHLDWVAVKRIYMTDAHIAQFMDNSGLTKLMESNLPSVK